VEKTDNYIILFFYLIKGLNTVLSMFFSAPKWRISSATTFSTSKCFEMHRFIHVFSSYRRVFNFRSSMQALIILLVILATQPCSFCQIRTYFILKIALFTYCVHRWIIQSHENFIEIGAIDTFFLGDFG
jgi:hypothetical protein